MAWLPAYVSLLAASFLLSPTLAAICPDSCVCSTTRDGLHRATCSNLAEIYKYTLRQKHHNINILDLSHNNITKITHELDKLTEVVTLDLSTNGLTELNKFLHNAKKLVHLNLAHNRIQKLSLTHLPTSVSSLDLTSNLLKDLPSDLGHLPYLEHLELNENPLDCSCNNIIARNRLLAMKVYIDDVKCHTPVHLKGQSWLELKTKDLCKVSKTDFMDMMMGDQPVDAVRVGEETTALKSMPLLASSDLEDGKILHDDDTNIDDDSSQFIKVGHYVTPSPLNEIEGSGEAESTTMSDIILEPIEEPKVYNTLLASDELLMDNFPTTTDSIDEGSGEGSGFGLFIPDYEEKSRNIPETTTQIEEFKPDPVERIKEDENITDLEFPTLAPPSIYQGGSDWHSKDVAEVVTAVSSPPEVTRDTTVSEQIRVTQASEVLGQAPGAEDNVVPHKTGTYVCIALIIVLLVGLIGFAIAKGQMRKRRDRRLLRQQKRDIERASKEMVDMNKSLLGKPAAIETKAEKKVNGKYELVPTHESHQKKGENGGVGNGMNQGENDENRTDSPRDTNQNKNSSIDNNLANESQIPAQETSFESDPGVNSSRKDTNSLSSEDIFVPINDDDGPRINGNRHSDVSQPLINGDPIDSDYLSPSREYVPVYSPDMGRVRIKMSETPKPKTPVLVTRSRSNAGDIIITPSLDVPKSTT